MAIQKSFPTSRSISPSIRITEKDLSFVRSATVTHRSGLVGFASKGPINRPVLIRSRRELANTFGYPHPESGDPFLLYAAQQYLMVSSEVYIVRVADEDVVSDHRAEFASVEIPAAGGQISFVSDTAGPYEFDREGFFRWRLNGVLSATTLAVPAKNYTTAELIDYLNSWLVSERDGIEFFRSSDDKLGVRSTFAYGPDSELELVSVQDSIYGGPVKGSQPDATNVTGLGASMSRAVLVGSKDRYPNSHANAGEFDFTGLSGLNLRIVVDGSENVLIDNTVQIVDLKDLEGTQPSTADVVNNMNSQRASEGGTLPGGWEAYAEGDSVAIRTLHYGRDARLLVKSSSSAAKLLGFSSSTAFGESPVGPTNDGAAHTFARINGSDNTSGNPTFNLVADSAGLDGNATQVVIRGDNREGTFTLEVFNNGVQLEAWGPLSKNENNLYYVGTYLDSVSKWIRVEDIPSNPAPPKPGTYRLSGGSDGIPSDPDDQDDLIIGSAQGYSGVYALSEPEQIDIDLLAVPGHSSTAVVLAMLDVCQNARMDCLALVDPPFGLNVSESVAWQNGRHPLNTIRFDSDFGALYWPWVMIRDNFNGVDVWTPPSGSVLATYALSDSLAAPWFAPAGETRGVVPNIIDVFSRPTLEERDLMYGNENCINPIVSYANLDGFVIMGQKTLQRRPTALDRVNIRRLLFFIEKRIRAESRQLLFDPHDAEQRNNFVRLATNVLTEVQVARGIEDFVVQCDEELNPPEVVERYELRAKIGILPIKATEFIFIEFAMHGNDSFNQVVNPVV